MCAHLDAPRLDATEQVFCYSKMRVKAFQAGVAPNFGSCGFYAALLSALLMTHNQIEALFASTQKSPCSVSMVMKDGKVIRSHRQTREIGRFAYVFRGTAEVKVRAAGSTAAPQLSRVTLSQ